RARAPAPHEKNDLLRGSGCVLALNIFQSSSFAAQTAQVIELRAAYFGRAHDIDFINDARTLREDALHALAETDLAHGEAGLRPARARNDHAFERLQALFVAFFDPHLNTNSIARNKIRKVSALRLGKKFFDD